MFGGMIGLGVFFIYAIRTPLTSKLYKEALYSLLIGTGLAAQLPLYNRRQYIDSVGFAYDKLKARFAQFPDDNVPDSENINKNFGYSKWND